MLEKEENRRKIYSFEDRLVIKAIGRAEWIQRFLFKLRELYPADRMNFSPMLKNKDADGYHCFVNIPMSPQNKDVEQ